jgi:peptide/nickel transport system permease protein
VAGDEGQLAQHGGHVGLGGPEAHDERGVVHGVGAGDPRHLRAPRRAGAPVGGEGQRERRVACGGRHAVVPPERRVEVQRERAPVGTPRPAPRVVRRGAERGVVAGERDEERVPLHLARERVHGHERVGRLQVRAGGHHDGVRRARRRAAGREGEGRRDARRSRGARRAGRPSLPRPGARGHHAPVRSALRRVAAALLLVWLVASLTFVLVRLAPGDPAALLVPPSATADDAARLRAALGLDRPLLAQYGRWLAGVLRGDLGESFAQGRPVARVLGEALPASLALGGLSLALSYGVGVALGTWQAVLRASGTRGGRRADAALTVFTTAAYAAPSYWLGLGLVAVCTAGAARWGWPAWLRLPAFGASDPGGTLAGWAAVQDRVRHAILPVGVLAAVGAAGVARYARAAVGDALAGDFVRTAIAKGVPRRRAFGRHALAVALPPLVVLFALALPGVVAGSVFVEGVFAWPGVGRAVVQAVGARDYPVVLGAALAYAAVTVAANLAADLALPLVDPRRRAAGGG